MAITRSGGSGLRRLCRFGSEFVFAAAFLAAVGWPRHPALAVQNTGTTLPTGTILYLRLDQPVSTVTTHLNAAITAHEVREVMAGESVVVPIGAVARGKVVKVIPSSNPANRAFVKMEFTSLEIPGQRPMALNGRVTQVENARETILADGTVQGVLQSELPSSLLNSGLGKLGKAHPEIAAELQKVTEGEDEQYGTTIQFRAGTDLQLTLAAPLAVSAFSKPAAAQQIPAVLATTLADLLQTAPQRAQTKDGKPGDPINLIVVGTEDEVKQAFTKAGWTVPAEKTTNSIWRTMQAVIGGGGYGEAPISQLYVFGRPEDLAFEKTLDTFQQRHHLRLWRSPVQTAGGRPIWLVAAVHDTGFDIRPGVVSHATSPHLDNERAKVGADLMATGSVAAEQLITRPNPLSRGFTGTGGAWETDGRLLVVDLK
jgi:hypothetical protein